MSETKHGTIQGKLRNELISQKSIIKNLYLVIELRYTLNTLGLTMSTFWVLVPAESEVRCLNQRQI